MSDDVPAIGIEAHARAVRKTIDELPPETRVRAMRLLQVLKDVPGSDWEECKQCGRHSAIALGHPGTGEVEVWCFDPECHHYHKEQW